MKILLVVSYLLMLVPVFSIAAGKDKTPEHKMPIYKGSAAFEKMKTLAGTWKGKAPMGKDKKMQDITIKYKVAGGGSTVIETHFPDTPQEMVSVYHDQNKKLAMTHYCAMHNQPKLKIKSMKKDTIDFEFAGGTNLNPKKDMHMHSMRLSIKGKNSMIQEWTLFKDGKKANVSSFTLTRVTK